jgi:hypothetical protein
VPTADPTSIASTPPRTARRAARAVAVCALYGALVIILTWPLARCAPACLSNTTFTARYDALFVGWALAHETRALATAPATFLDGAIFHPARRALLYGEAAFGALPLFAPVFLATANPTLALNVVFLGGAALTATALHGVVVALGGSHAAGALAGLAFLLTPWVLWTWVPAAPNYALLAWLPVIVLLAFRARSGRARTLVPLGGAVVLQGAVSPYLAAAVLAPLGVLGGWRLLRRHNGVPMVGVVLVAAMALAALYAPQLRLRLANPGLAEQTWWPIVSPPPIMLPSGLGNPTRPTAVPTAALLTVGAGLLALVAPGHGRRLAPAVAHTAFWAIAGTLLSLPPVVWLAGHRLALPHASIAGWLPVYRILRQPERLGATALVGLALLAGLAFEVCAQRIEPVARPEALRRAIRPLLLAALALVAWQEYGVRTGARLGAYPLMHPPGPNSPLVGAVAALGGPVLELPVATMGPRGTVAPPQQARAMYRAIYHRQPLVNGYSGYWPNGFEARMRLARALPDPAALRALRAATGLRAIVVHLDESDEPRQVLCESGLVSRCADLGAETRRVWSAVAEDASRTDLRLVARGGDTLLFAVGDSPEVPPS